LPEPSQVDRETNLALDPTQPVVRRAGSHQFESLADGCREVLAARALRSVDEVGRELDRYLAGRGHMALSTSGTAVCQYGSGDQRSRSRRRCNRPAYLYATAALDAPTRGTPAQRRRPASEHQPWKSAPVKSNASPNSISMLSEKSRPKRFSRRWSSIRCSTAMNAPPAGSASYADRMSCFFFSRFQSCRIMPVVTPPARAGAAWKNAPAAVVPRSASPRRAMADRAMGSTAGRSKDTQRRCGWRAATAHESSADAPPTSHSVR